MKWYTIRNQALIGQPVEILIYSPIGRDLFDEGATSAREFVESLSTIPRGTPIALRLNSPGGSVWDGIAMHTALSARRQDVTVYIDGLAASIASVIAMAGREIRMPKNAMLMIHEAQGLCGGRAADMRKLAEVLDQHSDIIASIYAQKTGKPASRYRALMAKEKWFDGAEAHTEGLADTLTDEVSLAACFDFSPFRYRNVPAVLTASMRPAAPTEPEIVQDPEDWYPSYLLQRSRQGI